MGRRPFSRTPVSEGAQSWDGFDLPALTHMQTDWFHFNNGGS